jgi:hypothetical protein
MLHEGGGTFHERGADVPQAGGMFHKGGYDSENCQQIRL